MASSVHNSGSETNPSLAAPSSSVLSDAPASDTIDDPMRASEASPSDVTTITRDLQPTSNTNSVSQSSSPVSQIQANGSTSTLGSESAQKRVIQGTATPDNFVTPTAPRRNSEHAKPNANGDWTGASGKSESTIGNASQTSTTNGRGRRRGPGRPRGRGRGGVGAGGTSRGGGSKRKRSSEDGEDDVGSESSDEEFVAVAMTKSGRTVQKPAAFVPPPAPSPSTTPHKRKRTYRRNPESAVCRVCLRGTSPSSNMIVFCDGCNTPYHRFCHHPPIDQSVVDEVDKEWYCSQCEKERMLPVPEMEVADFVSAPMASADQRQKYFSSLAPGMLITLLMRATAHYPDVPLFPPDFVSRPGAASGTTDQEDTIKVQPVANRQNGTASSIPNKSSEPPASNTGTASTSSSSTITTKQHHLKIPPLPEEPLPEDHPENYPRPGHGLMRSLPPESEDSTWLVEPDNRHEVFTHIYQVDSRAASAGLNGSAAARDV